MNAKPCTNNFRPAPASPPVANHPSASGSWASPNIALVASLAFLCLAPRAPGAPVGPVFPPPWGVNWTQSGDDESIGRATSKHWMFANMPLADRTPTYWGLTNEAGVRLSFDNANYTGAEFLSYRSDLSTPASGILVWQGQTAKPPPLVGTVYTRCRVAVTNMANGAPLALTNAGSLGLHTNLGAVLRVTPGLAFRVAIQFQASSNGTTFIPAMNFFDSISNKTQTARAHFWFAGAFYFDNTPPGISNIPDQCFVKGADTGLVPFTVGDAQSPVGDLTVWASSDNASVLPPASIVLGGSGSNRTVRAIPPASWNGNVNVTVFVADGYATNSDSFRVTASTPPTISQIADQLIQRDTVAGPISFTVGDAETAVAALTLAGSSSNPGLVPDANIVFGGSGANRTVTATPNGGMFGVANITVTVSDCVEGTSTNFNLRVNNPPSLTANNQLPVDRCATSTITTAFLAASDAESAPVQIRFTVAPGGQGEPPRNGFLRLNETNLVAGSVFTMDDLQNGRVTYTHNCNCETNDDFTFDVGDEHGGATPTGQFTAYSFRIKIDHPNWAPGALDGSGMVGLGAAFHGVLPGTNADCVPQTLSYRFVTLPAKGTLTLDNTNTGAFTFTARAGETGADAFTYQVNDGQVDATNAGTFSLFITNLAPVCHNASAVTLENRPFDGQLVATDVDQPPQALTFSLVSDGSKGTVLITNMATGGFVYTPTPSAIGTDTFAFAASDGLLTGTPATVAVTIRPNLDVGDVLVTSEITSNVVLFDGTASPFVITSGGNVVRPRGLAVEPCGGLLVFDELSGLIRIDTTDGSQSVLSHRTNFSAAPLGPLGVAVDPLGGILVADGLNGLVRVNPATGVPTVFVAGSPLALPEALTVSPKGDVYVADIGAFAGQESRVVKIDFITGLATIVSSGGSLLIPAAVAVESENTLLVADAATLAGGPFDLIIRINISDGSQTVLTASDLLTVPTGIGVTTNGTIVVPNQQTNHLAQVHPQTGLQSIFWQGDPVGQPFGLTVVQPPAHPLLNRITRISPPGSGVAVQFVGLAGRGYTLCRSSDLKNWSDVQTSSANDEGAVNFEDPVPLTGTAFYNVRWE